MDIGLYFGSFNPVHIGHLIIGRHIVNTGLVKELWFVVSPQNPLKPAHSLLNEHHRFHLLQTALENSPGLKASNVEFGLPRPSYTIDTLTYLSEKYPQHNFFIVMGGDSFSNIHRWKNNELLLENYKIIVYERPGFNIDSQNRANISITKAPLLEISSTHIRHLIQNKKSIEFLVTKEVKEEIEQNNYYALKNNTQQKTD